MSNDPKRLFRHNFTIYGTTSPIMTRLRARLETVSDSEVIRSALRYFSVLVADQEQGQAWMVKPLSSEPYVISYSSLRKRSDNREELTKRNIILNEKAEERIEDLKSLTGLYSASTIVVRSLRYLDLLFDEASQGATILIVGDGRELLVRPPILFSSRKTPKISQAARANTPL